MAEWKEGRQMKYDYSGSEDNFILTKHLKEQLKRNIMAEKRCKKCNKLLGYIQGDYEIKCPRCGEMNTKKESV